MPSSPPRPLGVILCVIAALVFATPTLFLPADAHASTKVVFIVVGSALLAAGVIRVRREGVTRAAQDEGEAAPDDVTPE